MFKESNGELISYFILTFVSSEELLTERDGEEIGEDKEEYEAKIDVGDTGEETGGDLIEA